ncbi:MAG: hypothetical protein ACD_49C00060G0003 [uncultured bacterium (gcode 4)]|uniref:Uncharacterized protein n=1 Tax=uncultured bacterium (gcode 4) TaxID=1234023 RepID=K2AWX0_9BACT|nr:MAG: hypothetical protein ACD_49C00060G0003 [uncultured bacterium (gcode 4)]
MRSETSAFGVKTLNHKLKSFKGFTLVELIVVISILAILWTIAFLSFWWFSSKARDSDRISDTSSLSKWIELYQVQSWVYPTPENISWTWIIWTTTVAYKWEIQNQISSLAKISKTPKDPLSNNYYIYWTTSDYKQYQIATTLENSLSLWERAGVRVYADSPTYTARVIWNYKWLIKFSSWTTETWIANIPSLIYSSWNLLSSTNLYSINKSANLPYQIKDSIQWTLTPDKILLQLTWTAATLTWVNITNITTQTGIINSETLKTLWYDLSLLEKVILWTSSTQTPINSCATQPTYTNATFTPWSPTQINQVWQSNNSANPCYWTCGTGKTLVWNNCVSESCSWTDPNTINAISNATSTAGWTWNYNITPWVCTYSCNTNYTYNWSNACTDQTAPTWWNFTMPATTNSTSITLTVTCPTDAAWSTPIQIAYGNTSNPTNWTTCTSSISHTLTTWDWTKTVYVRFKDSVGNISGEVSNIISALIYWTHARVTNASYSWKMWWLSWADQKCNLEYTGSHLCRNNEFLSITDRTLNKYGQIHWARWNSCWDWTQDCYDREGCTSWSAQISASNTITRMMNGWYYWPCNRWWPLWCCY